MKKKAPFSVVEKGAQAMSQHSQPHRGWVVVVIVVWLLFK